MYMSTSMSDAKRYYTEALAQEDYYTKGRETVGLWGGEAAKLLGLEGQVTQKAFARLCQNQHPMTGEQLTARTRDDRTVGYDVNFHVPKGISLLHAMTGDERIVTALREVASNARLPRALSGQKMSEAAGVCCTTLETRASASHPCTTTRWDGRMTEEGRSQQIDGRRSGRVYSTWRGNPMNWANARRAVRDTVALLGDASRRWIK